MCNTCAKPVQTLSKNSRVEHNLYALLPAPANRLVLKSCLSTNSTHLITHYFSTQKYALTDLLNQLFSTLCTGPITNTIK